MTIQVLTWFGGFADTHPLLAIFLMLIVGGLVKSLFDSLTRIVRDMLWLVRIACRVLMVSLRGWPPVWLDADGDSTRPAPIPESPATTTTP